MSLQVVILAAGAGKRMKSQLPKVLHPIAAKPMLLHVLETARMVANDTLPCVVYGHEGQQLKDALANVTDIVWVSQAEQLGTGHALLQALPAFQAADRVLVLYGDVPLIRRETLQELVSTTPKDQIGVVTAYMANPFGCGRIKRDMHGRMVSIIEEKDATEEERKINEVNSGIYCVSTMHLERWLPMLHNRNAQNEYYLTDIIKLAVEDNMTIHTVHPPANEEIQGVNDRVQLAKLERFHQQQQAEKLMQQGVTLLDPMRIDIRGEVEVGQDVVIDVNVILQGRVKIGNNVKIGANTILKDVVIGDQVEIKSHCVIEEATLEKGAIVGPFARLRPGTVIGVSAHVGNFVEIKNSHIGSSSKINHLSYIGDCEMGKRCNIGAGTITCNYDGAKKYPTHIGDDVHIGSDTQLVAPVTVGEGATIGAGSTVIKDAPAHQLTITARLEQRAIKGWERPV